MSWCPNEGAEMGYINGIIKPFLFSEVGDGCSSPVGCGDVVLVSPCLNCAPLGEVGENLLHLLLAEITGWKEINFFSFWSIWSLPADVFSLFNMFSPSLQLNNGILKAIWYHRFPSRVLLASVGSSVLKINAVIRFKVIKREQRDMECSSCMPHDTGKIH